MAKHSEKPVENTAPAQTHGATEGEPPAEVNSVSAGRALSPVQRKAIELLARGRSIKATGREAGVGRTTIYRWMREDPEFIAVYNLWSDELIESARTRLASLINPSVDTMAHAIRNRDARCAATLLKEMKVLGPRPSGPHDPAEIRKRQEIAARHREAAMMEADNEVYDHEQKALGGRPEPVREAEAKAHRQKWDEDMKKRMAAFDAKQKAASEPAE